MKIVRKFWFATFWLLNHVKCVCRILAGRPIDRSDQYQQRFAAVLSCYSKDESYLRRGSSCNYWSYLLRVNKQISWQRERAVWHWYELILLGSLVAGGFINQSYLLYKSKYEIEHYCFADDRNRYGLNESFA